MTWSEKCRERRARGLCHKCDSPPVPGRTQCQHHLDIDKKSINGQRAKRQAAGLCVRCGKLRAKGDVLYCKRHRHDQRAYERKFYQKASAA